MKIVVVGGTGTLGSAIVKELAPRHELVIVGRNAPFSCDIGSEKSIRSLFAKIGSFDALVSAAGSVHFEELSKMTPAKYELGLQNKLMGQVNLVLCGLSHITPGGSFTLTSGILNHDPIRTATSAAMVNGALEGFVRAAAIDLPKQVRINLVCPTILTESIELYDPLFRGFRPVPAAIAALAYSKSVECHQTGQVYQVT
jgi:NAD(P)-dependent dehydrogenase (short-subunit alcohol dehydrogenase family)